MIPHLVLDAAAFDTLDTRSGAGVRDLAQLVVGLGGTISCAAVTLAEVSRGRNRRQRIDAALARRRDGHQLQVVPTDVRLAHAVGALLHASRRGSESIADAHVVAVAAPLGTAIVVTSDPDDIAELAQFVPGSTIFTRSHRG